VPGFQRDCVHQPADRVVDAQVAVGLLDDAVWQLGAQHHARSALVDLELVQGALELPALGVERRELGGRRLVGVEDRGQQPVAGVIGRPAGVLEPLP
jgi:hypothetical protein